MIEITKLTVRSFDLNHMNVLWEINSVRGPKSESLPHEIYDYEFYILRSEAALGPYAQVGGPLRDTYRFTDLSVNLLHKWRQYYYKIRVVHVPTGEETESPPASTRQAPPDLIAADIIRQEDMLFREFVGRRCILYPVRTFGPACICFDAVTGRKTRSNHRTCFGTGWLGGYMSPVLIHLQIDPSPKASQPGALMERQSSNSTGRMISFPPISPGDIIIESENRRWRVSAVSQTERLRSVVHQELQLHEIPKGDVEYDLPVNVDIESLEPSAPRNFSNSQSLGEGNDDDIFLVYGYPKGSIR